MNARNLKHLLLGFVAAISLVASGCSRSATTESGSDEVTDASHDEHDGHDHGGWWCVEHAIPEEECAMCDTKLAADMREQGDWCEDHQRPDSQCFTCHPENAEKYAALYVAKYGDEPPAATE